MHQSRRRSNSFKDPTRDFKTKFETVEPEPVLEDEGFDEEEEDFHASDDKKEGEGTGLDQVVSSYRGIASDADLSVC